MNTLKRFSGLLWILLGTLAIYLLFHRAASEIDTAVQNNRAVLDTRMFWYIVIPVFTPIIAGFCLFGWYAWKGEYDRTEP